jgi:hypothetical protein
MANGDCVESRDFCDFSDTARRFRSNMKKTRRSDAPAGSYNPI